MSDSSAFTLITGESRLERQQLERSAAALRERVPRGTVYEVRDGSTESVITAILGLDGHCRAVHLVPEGVDVEPVEPVGPEDGRPTEWVIYTSGTTGQPKPVSHTLESLSRAVRSSDGRRTWGLVYDPSRLAGLAVVLQALTTDSNLVDARHGPIGDRVQTMKDHGVTAVSATPTLWRQILLSGKSTGWQLDRITLGGEVSDQLILDALSTAFPGARVSHIFAASETGVAFSVVDGKEGFPISFLSEPPRGVALRVREGVLWVHNPQSSMADDDGFASTEDVVELRGDRVIFLGRASGMVNVGGSKVFPEQVERTIREHPSVADAVVYAKRNPFSGHILLSKAALRPGHDVTGSELRQWVAARLPNPMVPAQVEVVEELERSGSGKAKRA